MLRCKILQLLSKRKLLIIMNQLLDYPEAKPLSAKTNMLLVMLHGLGSDGNDLISLTPFIQKSLSDYYCISPHGIEAYDMAPFGRQWFSLKDRSPETIASLLQINSQKIQDIIISKQNQLNLSTSHTVLMGFSQGAMVASYITLAQEKPYAAMVSFSGRVCAPRELKNTSTPICIVHGMQDDVVPVEEGENFAKYCQEHNILHQLKLIPNLAHSIDASGLKFVVDFLKNIGE